MKQSKKVLSVLLVVAMMLTMFSFTAFAGEIGTQGMAENKGISSIFDLDFFGKNDDANDDTLNMIPITAAVTSDDASEPPAVTPTPGINVSFRLIGGTLPEDTSRTNKLDFGVSYGDYKGAEYKNWVKTTSYTLENGTLSELVTKGMTDYGRSYNFNKSGTTTTVKDPTETYDLKRNSSGYSNLRWCYTVLDKDGKTKTDGLIQNDNIFNMDDSVVLAEGDKVIIHCVYDYRYELLTISNPSWEEGSTDGYVQHYLKTPDFSEKEYNEVISVENQITALEKIRLTPDSKELVESVRKAFDALSDEQKGSITNLKVLETIEAELEYLLANLSETKLPAPVMNESVTANLYSISASADIPGGDDFFYTLAYSISTDGKNWGAWQTGGTFEKLLPAETYYVRAMAQTDSWTKALDSDPSAAVEVKTTGSDATPVPVSTYADLQMAMLSADTTGALTVIDVQQDIVLNDIQGDIVRFDVPAGANVVLTSSNGSRFFMNESSGGSGIFMAADSILTVKDFTIAHLSEYRTQRTTLHPNNDWAHLFRLNASSVLNLDGSVYYGDTSAVMATGNGTVNIYSGSYNAIGRSTSTGNPRYKLMTNAVVNLIPNGDILLDGPFTGIANVNLNPQLCISAGGGAGSDGGDLTAIGAVELYNASSMAYDEGLRIFASENKAVTPLSDIVILPADDENAASADVTYIVGDNQIEFTKKDRANAVFQIIKGNDICSSESDDNNGIGNIFTYAGLTKDTEYQFTVTYHTLSAAYSDVTKEITIKTTYTPVVLDAPVLTDNSAEMIDKSITLGAPDACAVDEANASLLYRMSEDNEVWGEWQESNVFEGLKANTKYYFQAMYKVGAEGEKVHLYSDSPESNTLELTTAMPALAAPVLTGDAVATLTSITLPAAPVCVEDETAVAQYAISSDGETWGEWQESNVFDKLSPGTEYQFKVRYYTTNPAWLNSDHYTAPDAVTYSTLVSKVVVSDAEARSGKEVEVTISLENNPGIVGLGLKVNYDREKLELVKAENSGNFNVSGSAGFTASQNITDYPYVLQWDDSLSTKNYTGNDVLATLTFKIKADCAADATAEVAVEVTDAYDFDMENQTFEVQNGEITVAERFWNDPVYVWADDYSTCTATRTCCDCGEILTETETATVDAEISKATCENKGLAKYTAVFENEVFAKQEKEVELDKINHAWSDVSYEWSEDNATCTASRTCSNGCDGETETVETTVTTDEFGNKTYIATFVNAAFAAQSKEVKLENVTVTFRLIGATKSSAPIDYKKEPGNSHGSEYATWIATKTYEMKNGASAYDLFLKVAEENNLTYKGSEVYISSITAPAALGGYELNASTNGSNGGWMYTVNNEHAQYTMGDYVLKNNDAVIVHYINDWRTEENEFPWLEAEDVVKPVTPVDPEDPEDPKDEVEVIDPSKLPFTDVKVGNWFAEEVAYVYSYGLMNGTSETTFAPDVNLNRAMMATILYRIEGEPAVSVANPFTDVPADKWYTDAIIWAEENGIVTGYGDGIFKPTTDISREQMACMMYRYAKFKGADVSAANDLAAFTDAKSVSDWAEKEMKWAVEKGLINGMTTTTLVPQGTATRAQAATVLMRFNENIL